MKAIGRRVLIETTIKQIILESNLGHILERVEKFKYRGLVTDQTLTVERARQLHREKNFFKNSRDAVQSAQSSLWIRVDNSL